MRLILNLCLLALLALAAATPAAAAVRPTQVTVTRAADGEWLVDYRFHRRAPAWFFFRSNPDLDGRSWRLQSWKVETPGVALERSGSYDVLAAVDGKPLSRVRIRMRPFAHPLRADYTPVLAFSDGGLAFFTGHFQLAPLKDRAAAATLPIDLNGAGIEDVPVALTFADPGRRLLFRGKAAKATLTQRLAGGDGDYIYSGTAPVTETEAFAGVIDAGLPAWVRAELDGFTPRLMRLYAERLGPARSGRPMAMVAWQGGERPGSSLGGSVLDGLVVMQISGKQVLEPNPAVLERVRWFIGHESAHFWMGQTVGYARRTDAWITEGSAQLLAVRATRTLDPGYDARAAEQAELDECLKLTGPGEPLAGAEERGEHRAYYGCGAMLLLAAEAAQRRAVPGTDSFAFLRALIDAHRDTRKVSAEDWLKLFVAVSGDAATADAIRDFLAKGSPDPRGFFIRLFTATGVAFEAKGEGLRLL